MHNINDECVKYLIALLEAAIHEKESPLPYDEIDWNELLELAKSHSVANIIYYSLRNATFFIDEKTMADFKDCGIKAASREAKQELEMEQIACRLEQVGIRFMFLKGSVIKNLYPRVDMRTMADLDLLIDNDKCSALREIMAEFGYEHQMDCDIHDVYYKRPIMNVEVHKRLMDDCFDSVNEYFGNGFERAVRVDGFKYQYALENEDFFVFMIAHTAKHFYGSGTGIRSVLDIFVYLNAYEESLDFDKINAVLEKMELLNFSNDLIAVSRLWFAGEKPIKSFEKMEKYIVSNGTYGQAENEISNRFISHYGDSRFWIIRKIKYFISTAFPGVQYMAINYPAVKKSPALIPLFWVKRFVSTIIKNRDNIKYRIGGVAKLKKEDLDVRKKP